VITFYELYYVASCDEFLGAFAKLQKAAVSFVMSVRPYAYVISGLGLNILGPWFLCTLCVNELQISKAMFTMEANKTERARTEQT
jgi:hypothetical protein